MPHSIVLIMFLQFIIIINIVIISIIIIFIISVLLKGRSFTANSGNKAKILPKGRSSI